MAIGIDLGGTKIEAQVFGDDWTTVARRRTDTPGEYDALVSAVTDQIAWAVGNAGGPLPVGIGSAGLVSPLTGRALTANLVANGRPFLADIEAGAGCPITFLNDCRAFALSEAVFGAARGLSPVVGLIIGTGVGGGVAVDGALVSGPGQFGGEFGHLPAPAHLVAAHGLPVVACGCGRRGCAETLIAGPGLERLAMQLTGRILTVPEIAANRSSDPEIARVWAIWKELAVDLMRAICMVVDPQIIVLGGGMSRIDGLAIELGNALGLLMWTGYPAPAIVVAQGGDASGARGAALAAWRAAQ